MYPRWRLPKASSGKYRHTAAATRQQDAAGLASLKSLLSNDHRSWQWWMSSVQGDDEECTPLADAIDD